jgi:polyhydroxyalkanoate synthesis regulator phasin
MKMTLEQRIAAAAKIAQQMREAADDLELAAKGNVAAANRIDNLLERRQYGLHFAPGRIHEIITNEE